MTCHIVIPAGHPGDAFLASAAKELENRFKIDHATIQIETGDAEACALAPARVL